jgi:hypothetical protein
MDLNMWSTVKAEFQNGAWQHGKCTEHISENTVDKRKNKGERVGGMKVQWFLWLTLWQARSSLTGFTPKNKLAFHSKSKGSTNYHMEINSETFKVYFYCLWGPNQLLLWNTQVTVSLLWTSLQLPRQRGIKLQSAAWACSMNMNRDTELVMGNKLRDEMYESWLTNTGWCVRFEGFTAVTMKNGVFLDVTPCGSC